MNTLAEAGSAGPGCISNGAFTGAILDVCPRASSPGYRYRWWNLVWGGLIEAALSLLSEASVLSSPQLCCYASKR